MYRKQFLGLALFTVALVGLTGCGHKLMSDNWSTPKAQVSMGLKIQPSPMISAPAVNDSVFITWSTAWDKPLFVGFLTEDQHLSRGVDKLVNASGEKLKFHLNFHHGDVVYPLIGDFTANGTPITAFDQDTTVLWYTFKVSQNQNGDVLIDQIRDDRPLMAWYECWVTGIVHPDSVSKNKPVSPDTALVFASTHTNLHAVPGIWNSGSWRTLVWAKKGRPMLMLPLIASTGELYRPGVFMKNADGTLTQLQNFYNLNPKGDFYPAFIANLGADGQWSNPYPNRDDRWKVVTIHKPN
jgi:hypothetical protein